MKWLGAVTLSIAAILHAPPASAQPGAKPVVSPEVTSDRRMSIPPS